MVVIVRGRFDIVHEGVARPVRGEVDALAQGSLRADVLASGDDDDQRIGEIEYPSDFADFKPRADLMLSGTCHTPRGRSMTECPVGFEVGTFKKTLRVVGRRVWKPGVATDVPGEPQAFTQMPIGYGRAFGGEGHSNPVGIGAVGAELPNVEDPAHPVKARTDKLPPAGFGPLNATWPGRAQKVGKNYGAAYREKRAPYYADDFDWSYFNAAPPDQQREYLGGDEQVTLTNLDPGQSVVTTRLPGIKIRAFANDVETSFREVPMRLDTLFVDAEKNQLYLTWRGLTKVKDPEFDDVTTLLVVSEGPGEEAKSVDHYRKIAATYEADPLELHKVLPKEEADLAQAFLGQGDVDLAGAIVSILDRDNPGVSNDLERAVPGGLAKQIEQAPEDESVPMVPIPHAPRLRLSDFALLEGSLAKLKEVDPARAEIIEKRLAEQKLLDLDPNYRPPGVPAPGKDAPGPGANLAGQDLSGRDLSGLDLSRANLDGTILSKAKLKGTKLVGASMKGTLLFLADLTDADATDADLSKVNAARAVMTGACLRGAKVEHAYFAEANLRKANLSGVRATFAFFTRAILELAILDGAELERADFEATKLAGASAISATFRQCLFWKAFGQGAKLDGATLDRSSFEEADFTAASFVRAHGERCNFQKAVLEHARFDKAAFPFSHFTEARAADARFDRAILTEARFFKARLQRASFVYAKLVSADLTRCAMDGARFTSANLFDGKLLGARGKDCDFSGANLKRSTLEP